MSPLERENDALKARIRELEGQESRLGLAEQASRESENKYQQLFREMIDGFALHEIIYNDKGDPYNYRFLEVNPAFDRFTGLMSGDIIGKTVREVLPSLEPYWIETYGEVARTGKPIHLEHYVKEFGRFYEVIAYSPQKGQFATVFKDITEHKRAQRDRKRLEGQLRQARKIEAIGRLAGGIAHDFNNLLSPIVGYSEMVLAELNRSDPLYSDLGQILDAAERARELTQQLLAFSRKQVLKMKVLNFNDELGKIEKMIKRLIREDIGIEIHLDQALGSVKADTSQIQQIIVNLVVNANDAMPEGGTLVITTENETLDQKYVDAHPGAKTGEYVRLSMCDTGAGMDKEILNHIFEPFFTTKKEGKGTGLGLATVYGIVKQHGGYIWAESEPGKGTTFSVYLPKTEIKTKEEGYSTTPPKVEQALQGETILVVEDEEAVRRLTSRILTKHGYDVIEANDTREALQIVKKQKKAIHLLLTDVIMPEMNGKELYRQISDIQPEMRVVFMSGYTDDVIANHGILDKGLRFLQKPFTVQTLTHKVARALQA